MGILRGSPLFNILFNRMYTGFQVGIMSILRRITQSSFAQGVAVIGGGTALAQAAGVLLSPILTRLYAPEDMGLLGLFVSFLGVASVLATLRYEVAIVAASSEEDALTLTRSSLILGVFTGLLGALALAFMRQKDLLGYGALPLWASFLIFPAIVVFAWAAALRYYAVRQRAFGIVGRFTVAQGVARPMAQVVLAFMGGAGLLLGDVLGRYLGLTTLWQVLPHTTGRWFSMHVLKRYKTYPLIILPSGFLNTLALMAPIPVFISLYGTAVGGSLALAQRVVALPVSLVGAAVADVFYSRAAEIARAKPQALRPFLLTTASRLFLIAFPFGLSLWALAPPLTPWIFGPDWKGAGKMIAIMAPWMVAQLTVTPISRVVFLSRWQWMKLIYDGISLGLIGALILSDRKPEASLAFLSWANVALYGLYFIILTWVAGTNHLSVLRPQREETLYD